MARVSDVLNIARGELGYTESPQGSNRTKYGRWFGRDGNPWCMMFVQWDFAQAGVKLPARTASCGVLMRAAQAAGSWRPSGWRRRYKTRLPGDMVSPWGAFSSLKVV